MLAGLGSLRLQVEKPASVFGKYGLLFLGRSIARQQVMGGKTIYCDFDYEPNWKN